jgi:hypothetical protein
LQSVTKFKKLKQLALDLDIADYLQTEGWRSYFEEKIT